jgi:hypothetical protein
MKKIFKKENGELVSIVKDLSAQLVVETVFDGRETAQYLRIYLDGDNPEPYGPDRPCLRVGFLPDGKTVATVSLINDPEGAEIKWRRS